MGKANGSADHLFILDDLAARRLLRYAPCSFCLIKDSSQNPPAYYVYSIIDLFCIPKQRVRRPIERRGAAFKGKWLIDLRDAAMFAAPAEAIEYLLSYQRLFPAIFRHHIDCWGKYPTEHIETAGTKRTAKFWEKDAGMHS